MGLIAWIRTQENLYVTLQEPEPFPSIYTRTRRVICGPEITKGFSCMIEKEDRFYSFFDPLSRH